MPPWPALGVRWYRQALRLAADQALLRMDVQAIFIALSRRGQTLVQRHLSLVDTFCRDETDPDALSRLFALDHVAARMRRNEENLLVLAGGEPGRWITRPVVMTDVLRAAAQEIDEHRRIDIAADTPDVAVSAMVAGDVIHLLAELMENATNFSPPGTAVRVRALRSGHGMSITIDDSGIGMPFDKLAEANHRLSHPAMLTSSLVGTMGLLVVARLAARHRLTVRLDSRPALGTTATVVLPERLLTSSTAAPSDNPRVIMTGAQGLPAEQPVEPTRPRSEPLRMTSVGSGAAVPHPRPPVPAESSTTIDLRAMRAIGAARPGTGQPGLTTASNALPDPDAIRETLSSIEQGISAAAQHLPRPPGHPSRIGRS